MAIAAGAVGPGCGPAPVAAGLFTTTGVILVLFILLVIVSRMFV